MIIFYVNSQFEMRSIETRVEDLKYIKFNYLIFFALRIFISSQIYYVIIIFDFINTIKQLFHVLVISDSLIEFKLGFKNIF